MFAECLIETSSWGFDDTTIFNGYIALNGNRLVSVTSSAYRGFNIVQLNVGACSLSDTGLRSFDTCTNTASSGILATYISGLPLNTVLIGITSDDASLALTANAKSALLAIGVNVTALGFRAKVSFVAQIGRPAITVSQVAPPGGINLKLTVNATGICFVPNCLRVTACTSISCMLRDK